MKKRLSLICAALICSTSASVHADTEAYVDIMYDFAEAAAPSIFPNHPDTLKIIETLDTDDSAGLSITDLATLASLVNDIRDGKDVTEANLPDSIKAINDANESWIFRIYENRFIIGSGTKPLTPSASRVCITTLDTLNELNCIGSIEETMTLVPAASAGGTDGCATLPAIATGTKVTYVIDSKATTEIAIDQKQTVTYTTVSPELLELDIIDESFSAAGPAGAVNLGISQVIEVADGWRSLKSQKLSFNDAEVAGSFSNVVNETAKLLSPASSYCTDQTWTTNAVKQTTSGVASVIKEGDTTPTVEEIAPSSGVDELVQTGKVLATNESLVIGDKTYNTIKVSFTNVLADLGTVIWYDLATGVDVKEVVTDNRVEDADGNPAPAVITETTVMSIE